METAALLFAFGTLWFWILVATATVLIFVATEYEKGWGAFLTLAAVVVALHIWGELNIFGWVTENPWTTGIYIAAYFVFGSFWGVSKWWFFVKDQREKYSEAFAAFTENFGKPNWHYVAPIKYKPRKHLAGARGRSPQPQDLLDLEDEEYDENDQILPTAKVEWAAIVKQGHFYTPCPSETYCFEYKPQPRKHKARILTWMTYWPWSFIWTMLNDPIKRFFKAIYYRLAAFLARMSDKMFADAEQVEEVEVKK
jgi:hypothetical protein